MEYVGARGANGTDDAQTDEGWLYYTVSADGQVTAAGLVDSCMSCHDMVGQGRLFGVKLGFSTQHLNP